MRNTTVSGLEVRLANLRVGDGLALGAETERGIVDITATAAGLGLSAPFDVDDLLRHERAAEVRIVLEAVARDPGAAVVVAASQAVFAPLVTRPEKIICVGFNYREHAKETGTPIPEAQPLFANYRNALSHHDGVVALPTRVARQFDYETELVVVFGRRCRDVAEADALDVVAGYTIGNDISARELQTQTSQFMAGKASDGFAPVGPWLTPASLVPNPNALGLRTMVNGEVRQDWTTRDMIYDCRKIIAFVTGIMTIEPGDILFTGAPQGVILGFEEPRDQRRWLRAGDEVVSEIEGLGRLRVTLA